MGGYVCLGLCERAGAGDQRKYRCEKLRFICLTDDDSGLDERIEALPFPDLNMPFEVLAGRSGTLLKLGIFCEGILQDGQPAIYIDLDSSVHGNIQRLAECLQKKRGLYLMSRHAIQTWRIRGLMKLLPRD